MRFRSFRPVILSKDWFLRGKRKDQPQTKDPYSASTAIPFQGILTSPSTCIKNAKMYPHLSLMIDTPS